MHEEELTALLERARADVSPAASRIGGRLAAEVSEQQLGRRWSPRSWARKGILIPVAVGVLACTGAGTYGAYQLTIPPYVGLDPGLERVSAPIPVNYRTDAGRRIDCLAYLEFRDVSATQRRQLNAMRSNGDWSGYGQQLYDQLPAANRQAHDGPEPVLADRVLDDLYADAVKAAPGLAVRATDGRPSIEGATIRCSYPDGNS